MKVECYIDIVTIKCNLNKYTFLCINPPNAIYINSSNKAFFS